MPELCEICHLTVLQNHDKPQKIHPTKNKITNKSTYGVIDTYALKIDKPQVTNTSIKPHNQQLSSMNYVKCHIHAHNLGQVGWTNKG